MIEEIKEAQYRASLYDEKCVIIPSNIVWFTKLATVKCMHVTDRTLRNWSAKKKLRKTRWGNTVWYRESDLTRQNNR